ncbi:MAG: hydrolase Nlp/P60 [Lachnospiraceae bacterium]|jgi:cell wall-associated NlpC family hydrolase|nr:hydrolase Nlp/P60 [Lachnospiraceae bacterium]
MDKKVAKCAVGCLATGLMVFAGTTTFATEAKPLATETAENYPVAGLSFSFGDATGVQQTFAAAAEETSVSEKEIEQTAAVSEYANLAIAQVNDYVNIRSTASEEGEILGKLYNNSAANVLEEENGWYKIQSGSVTGYVKCEFVVRDNAELAAQVRTRIGRVTTETLRVRKEASTESGIMDLVPGGEDLIVKDESIPGWVGVVVGDKMGYVSTEFVELRSQYVQAESREEEAARLKAEEEARKKAAAQAAAARQRAAARTSSTGSRSQSYTAPTGGSGASVANFALQFVGNPYVYGGSSLTNGTDCSGFVMSVYSNFGVGLPHSSGAQRGCGYGVSVGEAQPGDIMCYSGHVGIYIGNGQMVHASTSRTGIIVSGIGSPIAVRRILS